MLLARGQAGLEGAYLEVESAGGQALAVPVDVADANAVFAAAAQIVQRWAKLDMWVDNAAATVFGPAGGFAAGRSAALDPGKRRPRRREARRRSRPRHRPRRRQAARGQAGFVLLPRRWVVERSFAWATRFRRLAKNYECCATTLADLHLVAFACIMLKQAAHLASSP